MESAADEPAAARLVARRAPMLAMHAGRLTMEGVDLAAIAETAGTPTWVTGAATIRARYGKLREALAAAGLDAGIHYAIKANDHLAVLAVLARLGAGADAVSGGEIGRALAAGIPAARIVFSGVGKTAHELDRAVRLGVGQVNVESREELRELASAAREAGRVQDVALRINPDVDAGAHDKISTGRAGDKFGIPAADATDAYAEAAALEGVRPVGLAVHIGSQIMIAAPFARAGARIAALVHDLRAAGHKVAAVDAGGGLGISYADEADGDPAAFAGALAATLGGLAVRVTVEPGRWLVGPAGLLLARVVRVKQGRPTFLILDAAMNDLARPSLYGSWHGVVPIRPSSDDTAVYDIVGPVCESSDVLARGRRLPICRPSECVAILDTGAYGAVMSSTYNARPLAAQTMVDDGRWSVIRARPPASVLWRDDRLPDWFAPA